MKNQITEQNDENIISKTHVIGNGLICTTSMNMDMVGLRERAFLRRYLDCNDSDDNKALSKMHEALKNGKDQPIDWVAFYAYFDERINDLENPYIHEMTEELFFFLDASPSVIKLIDQYRETLLSSSYDII